jgi:prepilin peptidase CpaA
MHALVTGGLCLWALVIAWEDVRRRKIPNLLTLPAVVVAVVSLVASGRCLSGDSWEQGLWGGGFGLAVTVPAYALGKLGAGDAKLLVAMGVLGGLEVAQQTFVLGAGLALVLALVWWASVQSPVVSGLLRPLTPIFRALTQDMGKSSDQLRLPFGTLLGIGFCAALLNR